MARPWPPRGSGTGSCTLPPYGLWNHAAVPGGVRSSLIRLLLFALWNVVEGWRAAALNGHEAALGFMKDTDNACMCWPDGDTLYHFLLAPAVTEGGSAAARAFALRVLTSVSAM